MKPFLVITGMHRSGTSFLARALNLAGVYLGPMESLISNDWNPRKDNPRGHWEYNSLTELADKTLEYSNGSWSEVPSNILANNELGDEIKKHIQKLINHPSLMVGFKDPRILLCLESWLNYLPKNFLLIGIFRDPLKVAESLHKRNSFDYQKSLSLWKIYNERLLYYLKKYSGFLLDFDWPKEKILSEMNLIIGKLGLSKKINLSEWYSEELRQSDKTYQSNYPLDESIKSLYTSLRERSTKNNDIEIEQYVYASDELLKIIDIFLAEIQNQGNYFKNLNDKNLATIKETKGELQTIQSNLKHKESQIANLQSLTQEKESQIANLQSLTQEKESQIANLQSLTQEKESQIANLQKSFLESQVIIKDIQNSLSWKILQKFGALNKKKPF